MLKSILAVEEGWRSAEPDPSPDELRQECAARARLYRLLAGVFVEELGREFLASLRRPDALYALAEAGLRFDADFAEASLDDLLEQLSCEYTNLFAVSGGFPPVESVRLTGRYQQEPHFRAREAYQRMGFAPVKGRFAVFPDQLGIELMFVAELLERAATAVGQGDMKEFRRLDKEVRRFWAQHLGKWVRGYGRLIARAAEHSFYREMARFLEGFAEEEIAAMGLSIEDADQGRIVVPKADVRVEFNPDEPVCNGCEGGRPDGKAAVHPLQDLRQGM